MANKQKLKNLVKNWLFLIYIHTTTKVICDIQPPEEFACTQIMSFYTLVSYKPRIFKNEKYYHSSPEEPSEVNIAKHNLDFIYKKHACVGYYRSPDDCFKTAVTHDGLVYILEGNGVSYVHVPDGWLRYDNSIEPYLNAVSTKKLEERLKNWLCITFLNS